MGSSPDAIVCGGGTAGSVVAARLVEAGARVLVLEAGPDYGTFASGMWPSELADARTIPVSHDWGYSSGDELPGRSLAYERARVIGGCSAHNGCTISWGHRADYEGWAARGLPGWSADDLQPLFEAASGRLRVRRYAPDEVTPLHRSFIDAGVALGFPEEDRLESLGARPAVCVEPSNSPEGARWNAAFAYLDPVRERPELEIRGEVLVDRVLLEGGRAVGVAAIGPEGPLEARAQLVVLAAGVYGSPAMLLRSRIGPADDLRRLGVEPLVDLPGVGGNLHDHPGFELFFEPSEELLRRNETFTASGRVLPDEQGFAVAASNQSTADPFDLHVFPEVAMDGRTAIFAAYLTPRSRGRVLIRSADPEEPPSIDHAYLADPQDLEALVDGVEIARAFAATDPLAGLLAAELEPGPDARTRDDLRRAVRAGVIHYWHPVGTCAMGPAADPEAVTGPDGRVRGVEGLAVCDASLMPVTVRATTNLPTVVVGERVSRALVGSPTGPGRSGW